MKLLLSSLLLASLRARSSSCTAVVTQTADVSVMEGEAVNITCCWTQMFDRMRLHWLKNQTEIKTETFYFNNDFQGDNLPYETSSCSHLTFLNVTREDSGRYICRVIVEIPMLYMIKGNGTFITVTARDNTTDHTAGGSHHGSHWEEVLIYAMRCLPILALVITFCYISNFRTKAQQHRAAAPGNKLTSAQRIEENQEEEEGDEREIEAE